MRKGWKTRIDERRYFENKKEEREEKSAVRQFVMQRMQADLQEQIAMMKANHETH